MKRWLRLILQLLSIALFGLILWWGGTETWAQVLSGTPKFILITFLLRGLSGMVATTRLRVVVYAVGRQKRLPWPRLYYLTMTARALGLVVPRSLSTIGGKSVALRAFGLSLRRSLWIVLVDNLFDVLLLGAMTIPSFLFLQGKINTAVFGSLIAIFLLLLAGGVWWGTSGSRFVRLLSWAQRLPRLARILKLDAAPTEQLFPPPGQSLVALCWSVFLNSVLALSFYFIGQAVGVNASWWVYVACYPFVQLSLIVAITPGGLGIFDLGWLGLLRLGGVSETEVLPFVVAQRAYLFVFVLVWAVFSVLLSLTEKKRPLPIPISNRLESGEK